MSKWEKRTYDFTEIDRGHHDSRANTQPSNQSSSIDSSEVSAVAHEDGNAQDPYDTQTATSPETAEDITEEKSTGQLARCS